MRMMAVLLGLLLAVVASAGPARADDPQARPATKVCTLKVSGMTCAGCEAAVKLAAKKVDGVRDAKVSYDKGAAEVTYDPAKTTPEAIAKAITKKTGFKTEAPSKTK